MPTYFNPVKVIQTGDWLKSAQHGLAELRISRPLIVTSHGNLKRLTLRSVFDHGVLLSDVLPNPSFASCQKAIALVEPGSVDGVIALGGGSVMDTAKIVLAYLGTGESRIEDLLDYTDPFPHRLPAIFIPTTHGTGSEVTMWGTVWNMSKKTKHSISHRDLYPDQAILDGRLTLSLPLDVSIATVLDALSHSFEAIWNKNANLRSTKYALSAITAILTNVDALKLNPLDVVTRCSLLEASMFAGLAFSNTQTAAAHSISYPLTAHFGLPHGIASSLALIPLLEVNGHCIRQSLSEIRAACHIDTDRSLKDHIQSIPRGVMPYSLGEWGITSDQLDWLVEQSFTTGRIDNNIVDLSRDDVRWILNEML